MLLALQIDLTRLTERYVVLGVLIESLIGLEILIKIQLSYLENLKSVNVKQRELERKLRYEKRDLNVLKAREAPEEEIKAQRLRVKNARTELNDFCDETGRARRSSRDRTPIQATWPQ